MELSETEKQIILMLREKRPFQRLVIQKDKSGSFDPDAVFVEDTRKFALGIGYMKIFKEIS